MAALPEIYIRPNTKSDYRPATSFTFEADPKYERIGNIDGTTSPLFWQKSPHLYDIRPRDYGLTEEFMDQVASDGAQGKDCFIGGDSVMSHFFDVSRSGEAIEMILNCPEGVDIDVWNQRVMWTEAARSVIGRKFLVEDALSRHALGLMLNEQYSRKLNLLSLASGWGRGPLDVIRNVEKYFPASIEGFLVDNNCNAINASCRLVEERGLRGRVSIIPENVFELRHQDERWNHLLGNTQLIESTGLFDYLPYGHAKRLLKIMRGFCSEDGIVAITNIVSDREEDYLDIVWGKMIRRTPTDLVNLAIDAGFDPDKTCGVLDYTETMCTLVTSV